MNRNNIENNKNSLSKKLRVKWNEIVEANLPKLIKISINYLKKIRQSDSNENPDNLEDFSPVILTDEENKHCSTIKYAIDNHNIHNLALTGPNGSGKSSILKTFEYNHPELKCLNISLATFDERTLETEKIEYNILKQLFYSVEHKKIPESRFKRIENHTGIWWKTLLFTFWIFSITYFLKIELIENIKANLHLDFHIDGIDIIYGLYLLVGTFFILNKVMNFIINFKLTKFKIKETDFETSQDKKTINFENEIDEILYFFEKNPIEIVFIQDIDRFKENKSEIFIKLREINNLLNNYEPIKKIRKITFIYAVTDDIFKENERSKFFDFILPVIPIINYSSSSSKIIEKLNDDILNHKLSKEFIEDISLFLNDYRTIKSIYNEYTIYKKILGKELLNYNNLLAMMVYKNIEPTDFGNLNNNEGYVFNAIENSNELIEDRVKDLDNEINTLKTKLDKVKNEKLKDVKELRMLYLLKFCELINSENNYSVFGFHLKEGKRSIKDVLSDEYFDLFRKESNIKYYRTNDYTTTSSISFNKLEKELENTNYIERFNILKNSEKEKLNRIKIELHENENKKIELNSKKLFELLDNNNSTPYFEKIYTANEKINNLKLINFLISKGYINEDYNHYISYFHPGSISKEDNDFLISLLPSEKALPFNHKLKEISSLIKKIKKENFNRDAILNFSLLDYFVENKINIKINSLINILMKGDNKSIQFIEEYLNHTSETNKSIFFKILLNNWTGLWQLIISNSYFHKNRIEEYLKYIFKYLDLTTIEKIDNEKLLSNYINKLEDLNCFNSNDINIEIFKKFIENPNVKFENLKYNEDHKNLFEFIYEKNKYKINENMIELFISKFNQNGTNIEQLKTANYTTIKNSALPKLIKYIDEYLDEYIENVYLKLDSNNNESEEIICSFLNNEDLYYDIEIIEKGGFIIEDLSKINNIETQSLLIINEKIKPTWKNLITYYKETKKIDETLIDYLNNEKNYNILSKTRIDDVDKNIKSSFTKDLIKSKISNDSFSKISKNLPFFYNNGKEFVEISSSKMKLLIESKTISLSLDNYIMIEEEFDSLLISLLEINLSNFMKNINDYELNDLIILDILNSKVFTNSQKLLIIEQAEDSIFIDNKNLLIKLSEFLLTNKINKISSNLLAELISNAGSLKNKVELTNKYFLNIETINLRKIVVKIGEPYSRLLLGKHPKVDNTSYNQELIKNLSPKLISKSKLTKDNKQFELFPYAISKI